MYTVITIYEELFTGKTIIKRETCDDGRAAKEAFCIYIMDPDCAACMVLDNNDNGKFVLRFDQERFEQGTALLFIILM